MSSTGSGSTIAARRNSGNSAGPGGSIRVPAASATPRSPPAGPNPKEMTPEAIIAEMGTLTTELAGTTLNTRTRTTKTSRQSALRNELAVRSNTIRKTLVSQVQGVRSKVSEFSSALQKATTAPAYPDEEFQKAMGTLNDMPAMLQEVKKSLGEIRKVTVPAASRSSAAPAASKMTPSAPPPPPPNSQATTSTSAASEPSKMTPSAPAPPPPNSQATTTSSATVGGRRKTRRSSSRRSSSRRSSRRRSHY